MDVWHITISADGRRPLFPTEAGLRAALRTMAHVVGPVCLLFSIVDEHLHNVVACSRLRAGHLAGGLKLALRPLVAVPTEPARIRPVESRSHMQRLVPYLLEQPVRHGLPVHPALWTGSCFPDLIGARVLPGFGLPLQLVLPRFRSTSAYTAVGLPSSELPPYNDAQLLAVGPARLIRAAAAAVAAGPELSGRSTEVVQARAAAAILASRAGLTSRQLAPILDVTPRAVQRLTKRDVDPPTLRAVRLRLALEDAVADACAQRSSTN